MKLLVVALLLPVLAACGTGEAPPTSAPTPSVTHTSAPSSSEIVHDRRARLSTVAVAPGPEGFTVSAWWVLRQGRRTDGAIVTSDDGFRTAHYEPATDRAWSRHVQAATSDWPHLRVFRHLVGSRVVSLVPGLRAYTAGGDGATLYPFQAVARSRHGAPWTGFVVPPRAGDRGYQSGAVVLPDGRFLVLLADWSSDRNATPGPEHHGLWVSDGHDWARFSPYRPSFSPPLRASERIEMLQAARDGGRAAPHGFVYLETSASRVYVSTDGARSFTRIRAR